MEKSNMNYGRQLKITRYMIQRAYLEGMLLHTIGKPSNDGDFSERYVGHIYPENRLWLKENGIETYTSRITDSNSELFGCEMNTFSISDEIKLTEEELAESNAYLGEAISKFTADKLNSFMGMDNEDSEYDDDDEEDIDFSDFPDFLK